MHVQHGRDAAERVLPAGERGGGAGAHRGHQLQQPRRLPADHHGAADGLPSLRRQTLPARSPGRLLPQTAQGHQEPRQREFRVCAFFV